MGHLITKLKSRFARIGSPVTLALAVVAILADRYGIQPMDKVPEWILWVILVIALLVTVINAYDWLAPKFRASFRSRPMITILLLGAVLGALFGTGLAGIIVLTQNLSPTAMSAEDGVSLELRLGEKIDALGAKGPER